MVCFSFILCYHIFGGVMDTSVIVSIVVAIVGIFTFIFSIIQFGNGNKIKRAEFFKEVIDKIRFDEDLIEAMTILDYHGNWYDENFPQSQTEVKIDKLFAYLSYVCYMYKNKIISKKEFPLLEYKIKRACQNKDTQNYLKFVNRFAKKNGIEKHTFDDLIIYMEKNVFTKDEVVEAIT